MRDRAFLFCRTRSLTDVLARSAPLFLAWHGFSLLMAFEILHCALMGFGLAERRKSSQVAAFAGLRVFLARIQSVLTGFQFANHLASVFGY